MTESKAKLARLRDEPATLQRLIADAASWLDASQEFAPKDFWATELLRAIATGTHIATPGGWRWLGQGHLQRRHEPLARLSDHREILRGHRYPRRVSERVKHRCARQSAEALHGTGMRSPWAGSAGLRATRVHKGSQAQHPISLSARISQPRYERDTAPRDGIPGRPLLSSMDTKLNIPLLITRRS